MAGGRRKRGVTFGDVIRFILMLAALCVFLYSGWTLYGFYKEYKKGSDEYDNLESSYTSDQNGQDDADAIEESNAAPADVEEVVENGRKVTLPLMTNPINFDELTAKNSDIVGWLRIRALDISYPVVQGEDNDFYLHRTFEKEDNFAGCLFVNSDNRRDFTDQNTIVYGHNMKNGSMFGKLKNFNDPEVFNKSKYFWIFTPELIYQYRIFSASTVHKTGLTYQIAFTDDEYTKFINQAFSNSVVDNTDVSVTRDDRIVTLSTCTSDSESRFVVMGKLEQIYAAR